MTMDLGAVTAKVLDVCLGAAGEQIAGHERPGVVCLIVVQCAGWRGNCSGAHSVQMYHLSMCVLSAPMHENPQCHLRHAPCALTKDNSTTELGLTLLLRRLGVLTLIAMPLVSLPLVESAKFERPK